ncbi:cyclic-phosphate processing receiver domain-containing protein [Fictibacillus sp. NRS-1165]|uniref:cyclic-phosphate processing receiver domain-containing protein n=1 Tax=Fictibacillus sp. NRS-1165 TaxID=3144463 RepID=UPI003D19EBC5
MGNISVFLDDYRKAPEGYVLAETIDDCMDLLRNFPVEHLSLDHDLVNKHRNGLMLVQMMVDERLFANRITIHSANSVGGKAMYNCLKQAQTDSILSTSTIVSLRPLPLKYFPPRVLQHYLDVQ